jgi:hypothetical protein
MAVSGIPRAVAEVVCQSLDETIDVRGCDETPGRAGKARPGIEQSFRAAVIGLVKAIDAGERDRDA